jgi:hypothetical protein
VGIPGAGVYEQVQKISRDFKIGLWAGSKKSVTKPFPSKPFPYFFFTSSLLLQYFFLSIDTARHHEGLSLYTMTSNDERMLPLSFSPSYPFLSCHD